VTENAGLALSSPQHPCDQGHLSVAECLQMQCMPSLELLRHILPPKQLLWWVLCVSGAGRKSSQPSKLNVDVICYTHMPFTAYKAVYKHKCIYTQAHRALTQTPAPARQDLSVRMYVRVLHCLEVIRFIPK